RTLLRLDRRPEGLLRRAVLAPEVHVARPQEQVVASEPRPGHGATAAGPAEAGRAGADRAGSAGRQVGDGLRAAAHGNDPRRPAARAGQEPRGAGVLRHPGQCEQVRYPLSASGCQEARDAGAAPRPVRDHAQRGQEAAPVGPQAASTAALLTRPGRLTRTPARPTRRVAWSRRPTYWSAPCGPVPPWRGGGDVGATDVSSSQSYAYDRSLSGCAAPAVPSEAQPQTGR